MVRVYGAMDIAGWFAVKAKNYEADLSNLKLQKLLYYAQGRALAVNGAPLFSEPIEAWAHGPVVSDVYHAYKQFGSGSVGVIDRPDQAEIDREARRILEAVWSEEGSKAAWRLREDTHAEPPWRNYFRADRRHVVIPVEAILDYFKAQHLAPSMSIDDAFSEWVDESLELAEEFLPAVEVSPGASAAVV